MTAPTRWLSLHRMQKPLKMRCVGNVDTRPIGDGCNSIKKIPSATFIAYKQIYYVFVGIFLFGFATGFIFSETFYSNYHVLFIRWYSQYASLSRLVHNILVTKRVDKKITLFLPVLSKHNKERTSVYFCQFFVSIVRK